MATLDEFKRFSSGYTESVREYRTIEAYHPQFDQTYRFVRNYIPVNLQLEASAPRDSGTIQTFAGKTLEIVEPSEQPEAEQVLSISFGNADSQIHEIIDQVSGSGFLDPVEIIYRKYIGTDKTSPVCPPLYLSATSINFENQDCTIIAEDVDLTQKRSGINYTNRLFPGLAD